MINVFVYRLGLYVCMSACLFCCCGTVWVRERERECERQIEKKKKERNRESSLRCMIKNRYSYAMILDVSTLKRFVFREMILLSGECPK